ncbi:Tof1 protein [Maudiozyma humilis]|uniref:Topoisomerase 1-associated factor 1 n=1 Tax=Maudiozyma humilis TaxID=51915 RepID=A0AAV5S253_MAUHU|nr:Tof1 protein [Kazachstania humilis]
MTSSVLEEASASVILKARIALLSTAIGGPDYTTNDTDPVYKLGDEALPCLKDLKRWFKLVDDDQRRLDVAMAAGEYKILTDDLVPILIEWENRSVAEKDLKSEKMIGKSYYDKVALQAMQLMVLMTWPLILTEQSTQSQVDNYAEVKKYQLIYKKSILATQDGKVLRAIARIVINVMRINRQDRTGRDNMIMKLALNLLRNIIAIEPGELTISNKQRTTKGINSIDTLPPGVTRDDISLNTIITSFQKNKIFKLLLTLSSSMTEEFDQDFLNMPLMEIMVYLTKDVNTEQLLRSQFRPTSQSETANSVDQLKGVYSSTPNMELKDLLQRENQMKKNLIQNTSSRHSRFGAMLSIQTPEGGRLTVSGGQSLLNDASAMDRIDARKKWNKRQPQIKSDPLEEGLPSGFLNSQSENNPLLDSTAKTFVKFLNNFVDSSFNILLHSINNHFTTEQDKLITIEQIEFLLFVAWFIRYQTGRCRFGKTVDILPISETLNETSYILTCQLLRTAYGNKNWPIVHAAMIAFYELLILVDQFIPADNDEFDVEYILSRLFSDDRLQLLTSLPKTAIRHSQPYMEACINVTHECLRVIEHNTGNNLVVENRKKGKLLKNGVTEDDVKNLMESENIDRDTAIEALTPQVRRIEVNFNRVRNGYMNEQTMDFYLNYLQRFRELNDKSIKRAMRFLGRALYDENQETNLFRLDILMLLHDMLGPSGLQKNAKIYRDIDDFSKYLLYRLKKRLKASPAWFVGLLFPSLHDSQVGYFQRFGEIKTSSNKILRGVEPSTFKPIEEEQMLPPSVVRDMKIGIVVSTLIDDGHNDILEVLRKNMELCISFNEARKAAETSGQPIEGEVTIPPFVLPQEIKHHLWLNSDLRALLVLINYTIPEISLDSCKFNRDASFAELEIDFDSLKKYMGIPFETPNGAPSSTYLIRPTNRQTSSGEQDGWNGYEDYDYDDPSIVRDDDEYFKSLEDNMEKRLRGKKLSKGRASTKKKPKKSQRVRRTRIRGGLPTFDIDEDGNEVAQTTHYSAVASKEYISDSDDEDEVLNPIFFENETFLRYLLDQNNGQLPLEKFSLYGKFKDERIANKGKIINDYTELFNGPVPSLEALNASSAGTKGPNQLLHDLSSKKMNETFDDEEHDAVDSRVDATPAEDNGKDEQSTQNTNENTDEPESEELSDNDYGSELSSGKRHLEDDDDGDGDVSTNTMNRKRQRAVLDDEEEEE